MLARDVRSEAAGTKGESYSSHYKGESYRCPTKETDLEKTWSARRHRKDGKEHGRKAHVFDFLGEKNVDNVEKIVDKINPCVKGCACCKAKHEKEMEELV